MPLEIDESNREATPSRAEPAIGANAVRWRAAQRGEAVYWEHARGSLRETIYWLRRAHTRSLIPSEDFEALCEDLEQLSREINQCINFQKTRPQVNPAGVVAPPIWL